MRPIFNEIVYRAGAGSLEVGGRLIGERIDSLDAHRENYDEDVVFTSVIKFRVEMTGLMFEVYG